MAFIGMYVGENMTPSIETGACVFRPTRYIGHLYYVPGQGKIKFLQEIEADDLKTLVGRVAKIVPGKILRSEENMKLPRNAYHEALPLNEKSYARLDRLLAERKEELKEAQRLGKESFKSEFEPTAS